jgi:putative MFS transporter
MSTQAVGTRTPFADVSFGSFHRRVAVASMGGVFSDGYGLGIIGVALAGADKDLHLTALWVGLLGGASLAGLFLGALLTGPFADQHGRRPLFAYNMALLALLSMAQFWVTSSTTLLLLRLSIGFLLGTDYVVSKAMLSEWMPGRSRPRIMGMLSIAWAAGYATAYFTSFVLLFLGDQAWRWMLLSSAVPCLLILPLRLRMPESAVWLVDHAKADRAVAVVAQSVGAHVAVPLASPITVVQTGRWRQLGSAAWRKHTGVACALFTCQVIPYFAVGTFVSRVLSALTVSGSYVGGLVYNAALLLGAVLGLLTVDRIARRTFIVGSFVISAAAMSVLTLGTDLPGWLTVALFAVFAGVLSAASNMVYVYLPELFPTDLRASGIGLAVASSRIGSAVSTFLLPLLVAGFGVHVALGCCVVVLVIGALICFQWAPETRHQSALVS